MEAWINRIQKSEGNVAKCRTLLLMRFRMSEDKTTRDSLEFQKFIWDFVTDSLLSEQILDWIEDLMKDESELSESSFSTTAVVSNLSNLISINADDISIIRPMMKVLISTVSKAHPFSRWNDVLVEAPGLLVEFMEHSSSMNEKDLWQLDILNLVEKLLANPTPMITPFLHWVYAKYPNASDDFWNRKYLI